MRNRRPHPLLIAFLVISVAIILAALYFIYPWLRTRGARLVIWRDWFANTQAHPEWNIQAGTRCGDAPFVMPTDGFVGFLWGDSFRVGHTHSGIDIFGGQAPGETPIVAAYSGYLTRLPDWKSTVIIRIPSDPLHPGRQIWTYYTHMADVEGNSFIVDDFPAGTSEVYVEAGTLLGYQGNFAGNALTPTGIHLHLSIVLDDGEGHFRNETKIANTLDPSPYLGLRLNAAENPDEVVVCP